MSEMRRETLTCSSIRALLDCQRKYYWAYEECLRPVEEPEYFTMGSAVHDFLEPFLLGKSFEESVEHLEIGRANGKFTADIYCKAMATCDAYRKRWGSVDPELEVIDTEIEWSVPIDTPDGGFTLGGKVDGLVRSRATGKTWIIEHKTTSRIDGTYLEKLWSDLQVRIYGHIASMSYELASKDKHGDVGGPCGVVYNVLLKPSLRRYKANKRRDVDEGDDQFLMRIADWYEAEDRFVREYLPLHHIGRDETIKEVTEAYHLLQFAKQRGYWLESRSRCYGILGNCKYLSVCRSGGVPGEPGPIARTRFVKTKKHEEIEEIF